MTLQEIIQKYRTSAELGEETTARDVLADLEGLGGGADPDGLAGQLEELGVLVLQATPAPWLLSTVNVNPRGLSNHQQLVVATATGFLGGVPSPKTTMQLQFKAYGKMRDQADGTPDGYWPSAETKGNAAFIVAARKFLTAGNVASLVRAVESQQIREAGKAHSSHSFAQHMPVVQVAEKVIRCLALELPEAVWKDAAKKIRLALGVLCEHVDHETAKAEYWMGIAAGDTVTEEIPTHPLIAQP